MSDAIIAAIIGAAVAIIAAIISGIFSYRAGIDQGRMSLQIAKEQWEHEHENTEAQLYQQQKTQDSLLIDNILSDLAYSLSGTAVKFAKDQDSINELEIKSAKATRFLYLKGQVEKKDQWSKAAERLHELMKEYFWKLRFFSNGQITFDAIDTYRNDLKNQVGDILGKALLN